MLGCGVFAARPGTALAASDAIDVTVRGRGGHASAPHRAADPIPAACEMVTALQAMVTRRFDVFDPVQAAFATATAADIFGTGRAVIPEQPLTGSEDFSFVLSQVPGAFILLGACPPGADPRTAPSNHSATAIFDDTVLADGTALYAELALRRLSA